MKEEVPAAVRDFSVSAKRGVVALSWVAPGEPGVELYRIFRDGEFLTSTQELAYIDRSLTKEVATYQVDVLYENGLYSPFASATVRVPVNRIESLSAVSEGMEVTLSWDMEMRLTRCTDMTLDNVVYEYVDCTELDYAQRFDAADLKAYIGYNISRISFFPFTSQRTTTYKIRVWRMPEGSDAAEVVSERTVSEYASGQWCERLLLDPVAIEAGYDYLIGVNLVTTDGTIRLICESENTNPGLGNLTMVDGIWSDDLLSLNPLLRADLEKGEEPVFVPGEQPEFSGDYDPATDVAAYPLGFNVYRDDELIGFTSSRTFIDCSASQGSHKYGVVCLYEGDNESAVIEKTVYHYAGVEDAAAEGAEVEIAAGADGDSAGEAALAANASDAIAKSENTGEEDEDAMSASTLLDFTDSDTLVWPIVGNVLVNYSMDKTVYFATLNQYKYSPAIVIAATEGEEITAAADGQVTDVYQDPETGTTVVMNLGDGYELTYGQLTDLAVAEGDMVITGDLIGKVAAPTMYYSVEGTNVYFKLTKDGVPVDPMSRLG